MTFRHLMRGLPRPLLRLMFPRRRIEPLGPLDPSLDRTRPRTGDFLLRVHDGAADSALHVEIEREWRSHIPERLFEYASTAACATKLPITSVVVLLRPGGSPPRSPATHRVRGIGEDAFVFRYRIIPLWRLDARRMRARLGVEGAPFCAAMRGADEAFVQELADDVRDAGLTERDRDSTLQLLYVVSAVIFGSETAKRIFHVESIMQDPNVQELARYWEDKGEVRGRAEEARKLLNMVLAVRPFPVNAAAQARIDGETDVARLEAWFAAAVEARSIRDVFGAGSAG